MKRRASSENLFFLIYFTSDTHANISSLAACDMPVTNKYLIEGWLGRGGRQRKGSVDAGNLCNLHGKKQTVWYQSRIKNEKKSLCLLAEEKGRRAETLSGVVIFFGCPEKCSWSKIEINVYILAFYLLHIFPYRDAHIWKQISTLFSSLSTAKTMIVEQKPFFRCSLPSLDESFGRLSLCTLGLRGKKSLCQVFVKLLCSTQANFHEA